MENIRLSLVPLGRHNGMLACRHLPPNERSPLAPRMIMLLL